MPTIQVETDEAQRVQRTTNYNQFSMINTNREVRRGHIESLKEAFEEYGNITEIQPIIVNDNMSIIDGQHRLIAAQELGFPVFYIVRPGVNISDARAMNALQMNWTVDDFAQSYATQGDPAYQRYLKLREDYGYNHSITLACIYGAGPVKKGGVAFFKDFRKGALIIDDIAGTRKRLEDLVELQKVMKRRIDKPMAYALLDFMRSTSYDHQHMVHKMKLHGEAMLHQYQSVSDYKRTLEQIYNYQMKTPVRLF